LNVNGSAWLGFASLGCASRGEARRGLAKQNKARKSTETNWSHNMQRPCVQCGRACTSTRCDTCDQLHRAASVKRGVESEKSCRFYNSERWRAIRRQQLNADPVCAICGAPATVVDHIIRHRGDKTKFYDVTNLQSLCKRCHDRKTMLEMREAQHE